MTPAVVAASPTTAAISPSHAPERLPRVLSWLTGNLPAALVLAACAWWLLLAPRLEGGRGAGAVTGGAILTALAVLAIRPNRVLPKAATWLALWISAAAFAVALLAPTGWAGAPTAASYVCASWTMVAVAAAVVRTPKLRDLMLLLVVGGVLIELAESWLAWWGGSDASVPISGTFYWYDPFAAFILAGTVIGLSYWVRRSGPLALFGLVGAALGTIGMIYSTSRAAIACFVVAVLGVAVAAVWGRGRVGAKRLAVGAAVVGFAVWAVGGPPFFPQRSLPFAGTAGRAVGQSLSQNGGYRLDFWREALTVFRRHPLVGGGYHSLASAARGHVTASWPLSPLAHNGYLQVLSDGGLLLAVPFLLAIVVICWYVVGALVRAVRRRDFSTGGLVVPLCLGALLAHSAVDFDWSYAADFEIVAILAGLVAAARWSRAGAEPAPQRESERESEWGSRLLAAAALVGVALIGVAAGVAWNGDFKQSLPIGPDSAQSVVHPTSSGG